MLKKTVKILESKKSSIWGPEVIRNPKRQKAFGHQIEGRSQGKLRKRLLKKVGTASGYSQLESADTKKKGRESQDDYDAPSLGYN